LPARSTPVGSPGCFGLRLGAGIISGPAKEWFRLVTKRLNFVMNRPIDCFLDVVSHRALEIRAVVSTEGMLLSVFHDDPVFAVKPGLHLFDLHDGRAVDASKLSRIELLFQTADRFT